MKNQKNMKNSLLIFCFVYTTQIFAQPNFEWATQVGNDQDDAVIQLVMDSEGSTYTIGSFQGTVDFDRGPGVSELTSAGSFDMYILKLDVNGDFLWVKHFSGSQAVLGYSISLDNNDNIIATGRYSGTVDFDPGIATSNQSTNGTADAFILKLDSSGDYLWSGTSETSNYATGLFVVTDDNNNIYISGTFIGIVDLNFFSGVMNFTSTGQNGDGFITKIDSNGNFQWTEHIEASQSGFVWPNAMELDQNNNLYITGSFSGTTDFNTGSGTLEFISSNYDVFILKTNSNGDFIWANQIGGTGTDNCYSIVLDSQSNIYVSGSFGNTANFDPNNSNFSLTTNGSADAFAAKYNSTGDFQWAIQNGGTSTDVANSINIIGSKVYIGGRFRQTVDFDPGAGTFELIANGLTSYDVFIQALDFQGNFIWARRIGSTDQELLSDLALGDNGSIYALGSFELETDFNPNSGLFLMTPNTNSTDGFIVKLGTCSSPSTGTDSQTACSSYTWIDGNTYTSNNSTATYTYINGASSGCDSIVTLNLIIEDNVSPVADIATLSDITNECEISSLTAPTATDNCTGTITGTHGATLPMTSTTTITWTYDDGNGNTSTQTQEVIIDDVTAPEADVTNLTDLTDECEITSLTAPTATDNCAGTITGTHGATLPITSTTTITWTYDDGNGNTSSQTQEVIIDDVTAPVTDVASLANITDECEVTSLSAPTATDNCSGSITGTHGATLPITSTTTITWTYNDGNGNTSTQTQEVIISPINTGVTQVDPLTLSADASGNSYQWIDCDDNNSPISGETNQTFEATTNGSYAVEISNGTCSEVSDCIMIDNVGLSEIESTNVRIFPNPTSDGVSIKSSTTFTSIEILNAIGEVVYRAKVNNLNNYHLKLPEVKGLYFIKISGDYNKNIFRIIKN